METDYAISVLIRLVVIEVLVIVNDNITMNREWKIKMYKNDH